MLNPRPGLRHPHRLPRIIGPIALSRRIAPAGLLLALCLSGCGTGGYPSLAQRPAELATAPIPITTPTAAPEQSATPDALRGQLAALSAQADAARDAFDAARPAAQTAITAARKAKAQPGSVLWAAANLALARLESAGAMLSPPLAQVERLYADDRQAHPDELPLLRASRPTARDIDSTRAKITGYVDNRDRTLTLLRGAFGD
ncbi:hypothetical protein GTZ99_07950 [Novosphingobium sp. FSY-8]|uniref:Lipoprotein n=1 Tax=Novosphingobium ovatum TaxID=1908523 RepID=A0ABW9XD62_9SPHN|nr:hypothetical protein [Novosphingobium ovatum]NBC36486.1 hypothetical protein [Novosphingobium ovatum]